MTFRLLLCYLFAFNILSAQNLTPNPGFEEVATCPQNMPERGIRAIPPWYIPGDSLIFTPDLFHRFCPISDQRAEASQFWNKRFMPYEGMGFVGLAHWIGYNGVYFSEAVGVPLRQPLKAAKPYFFSIQTRNKGLNLIDNPQAIDCKSRPLKALRIYLSPQPFQLSLEFGPNQNIERVSPSGVLVLADSSSLRNDPVASGWTSFSSCFLAQGGEAHLGISGPLGKATAVDAPCILEADRRGYFHQGYYDIDEVVLEEMPESLEAQLAICENEPVEVRLKSLIPQPMFEKAEFRWPDGRSDSVRVLNQSGVYEIAVVMPCATFPLRLSLKNRDCALKVFGPTAFSPNGDGINDEWIPFFKADEEVKSYLLKIFDRWGNLVFQSQNSQQAWDGSSIRQKPCSSGVYLWVLELTLSSVSGEKKRVKSGDVVLVK